MADIEKNIEINVNTNADQAANSVEKLGKALDTASTSSAEFGQAALDNGGVMGVLNEYTAGYASKVKDSIEALQFLIARKKLATAATTAEAAATTAATTAEVSANTARQIGIINKIKETAATVASKVAQLAATAAIKTVTLAQWLWNAAIAANPLVALVVAVVAAGVAIYKFTSFLMSNSAANDKAMAAAKASEKAIDAQAKAADRSSEKLKLHNDHLYNMAKAAGATSEELRKLKLKHVEEEIALAKKNQTIAKNTYEVEKNALAYLKYNDMSDEAIKAQEAVVTKSREALLKQNENLNNSYKQRTATVRANEEEIVKEVTDAENKKKEVAQKAADDAKAKREKAAEEARKAAEDNKKALADIENRFNKESEDAQADTDQKKLDLEKKRAIEELDAIKRSEGEKAKARLALEADYAVKQAALDAKLKKEAEDKRVAAIEANKLKEKEYADAKTAETVEALRLENEIKLQAIRDAALLEFPLLEENAAVRAAINAKYNEGVVENNRLAGERNVEHVKSAAELEAEFQKNKDEAIASSKANLTNIVSALESSGLAKTKAGQVAAKAIALTQIGIDSAVAISKASTLANAEGVAAQLAFPMVPGIGTVARVLSYVSTGLSVVSNIARAKKLLSSGGSDSGGGGAAAGGGGAGAAGAAAAAPSMSFVGSSANQIGSTVASNTNAQPPVKAYVVSQDVTTAQNLDRNLVNATSV